MHNVNSPKPGPKLGNILVLLTRFQSLIAQNTTGSDTPESQNEMEELAARIRDACSGADEIKLVRDRLLQAGQFYDQQSIYANQGATMCEHYMVYFEQGLITKLQETNGTELKGETWTAKVSELRPRVRINIKEFKEKAPEYMKKVELIDEDKLDADIRAGVEVPGTTVSKQYALEYVVNKREK